MCIYICNFWTIICVDVTLILIWENIHMYAYVCDMITYKNAELEKSIWQHVWHAVISGIQNNSRDTVMQYPPTAALERATR